jgi:RimJ/RimL family protein N-acetyltransferase
LISDQELMKIHVEALFTHDASFRLQFVNEPFVNEANRAPAPRFFLGRTGGGNIWRFRSDLPISLVEQLEVLCVNEPVTRNLSEKPRHFKAYIRLLEAHAPVQRVEMGPAYHVPVRARPSMHLVRITESKAEILGAGFEDMATELGTAQPFFGIVQEGHAVSICRSVRITARTHEAGVETLEGFRGRGYAAQVVAGWALAVRELGCFPLYSTAWENQASQRVARKLGLILYGADFHIM